MAFFDPTRFLNGGMIAPTPEPAAAPAPTGFNMITGGGAGAPAPATALSAPPPSAPTPSPAPAAAAPAPSSAPAIGGDAYKQPLPATVYDRTHTPTSMVGPKLDSQVDAATETVEGRIGGILATDGKGNYTNQVVRQAQERQDQAFNARGLRNSSIAVQGGTEAAISKAIDIAAPDAQTYFNNRRQNVADTNTFAMENSRQSFEQRKSYQAAVQAISTNFQRQLDTINASNMTPEDKSVAIQQAQAVRDGEVAYQNNIHARMPMWQEEWLAPSVATQGMSMGSITNQDTLANIVNDPAQPADVRQAAQQQLDALRGGTAGAGGAGGAAAGFPPVVAGRPVDWDAPPPGPAMPSMFGGGIVQPKSPRQQYEAYAAAGGTLSPEAWYLSTGPGAASFDGGLNANDPGDPNSTAGMTAANTGFDGVSGMTA